MADEKADLTGESHTVDPSFDLSPVITPGWQSRASDLRKVIRECRHEGSRYRNDDGQLFCSGCGRFLNEDGSEV